MIQTRVSHTSACIRITWKAVQTHVTGPTLHVSDLVDLGMGHPTCTFYKFPRNVATSGMGIIFQNHYQRNMIKQKGENMLKAVVYPGGWDGKGGRRGGSGWETHVHPWLIPVDVWQNHYSTVK